MRGPVGDKVVAWEITTTGITETAPGRGCAVGDFNDDGTLDVVVNCVNDVPQLLRCELSSGNHWIKIKCASVKSNRSGIGARVVADEMWPHVLEAYTQATAAAP